MEVILMSGVDFGAKDSSEKPACACMDFPEKTALPRIALPEFFHCDLFALRSDETRKIECIGVSVLAYSLAGIIVAGTAII